MIDAKLDTVHFHDCLRHFASWFVMWGGVSKEILGPATLATTMPYAHLAPGRRALSQEIRPQRAEVATPEQADGTAALDHPKGRRPTMRGFKIAHGTIDREHRTTRDRRAELLARRTLPECLEVGDVSAGAVVKLLPSAST